MATAYGQIPYGQSAQPPAAMTYAIPNASFQSLHPGAASSDSGAPTPGMTAAVAGKAIERVLSAQLKEAGFDGAEEAALGTLEDAVVALIQKLYKRAQEYGNLANRAAPTAVDMWEAAMEFKLEPEQLKPVKKKRRRSALCLAFPHTVDLYFFRLVSKHMPALELVEPPPKAATPRLLASDHEENVPIIPATLRSLPNTYPPLPPKHTYFRTPPSPPRKQDGQSRDKKLKNAALVQESLRNLLAQTEDVVDPEDVELLGAIVNWESTMLPRKKWKVHA
ncbi:hypothetical protein K488DRAFT_76199 [Vararia minispora EC-137]|uniref:Uncharacterized protein n=1 Tax=Vararia minispora EC-137 TaxID=1314806 RepID=A0ACB8QWG7_9AGAM|nr:hypothetical protein K488DRAFT_76199 [Vararia minispora EC-137]